MVFRSAQEKRNISNLWLLLHIRWQKWDWKRNLCHRFDYIFTIPIPLFKKNSYDQGKQFLNLMFFLLFSCIKSQHFNIEGTIISHLAESPIQHKNLSRLAVIPKCDKLSTVSYSFGIVNEEAHSTWGEHVEPLYWIISLLKSKQSNCVSFTKVTGIVVETELEKLIRNTSANTTVTLQIKWFKWF